MNRLDSKTHTQVISAPLEGCSIRSTVRMTGVSKKTVVRLLVEAGTVAAEYQDRLFRNLSCRRVQADEMRAFIGAKEKNVTPEVTARTRMLATCGFGWRLMRTQSWFRAGRLEFPTPLLQRCSSQIWPHVGAIAFNSRAMVTVRMLKG